MLKAAMELLLEAKEIPRMIADPKLSRSYYPFESRKSKPHILMELLWGLIRDRDANLNYYLLGFDRQQASKCDYLPYRIARKLRDGKNLHPDGVNYNYVCILRDKLVFGRFASALGIPTPRNLAICDASNLTWVDEMKTVALEKVFLRSNLDIDGFCKKLTGMQGKGLFRLKFQNGRLDINDRAATFQELRDRFDTQYLIQERLIQHPLLSSLHPQSINTIRLITFNNNGTIQPFCAALRIGTDGRSVDNWSSGGIMVAVDLRTGRLREQGHRRPGYGGFVREHPQTRVRFGGFELPKFQDALELAMKLHKSLYGIHSIGWDIAITETTPVIVEGNDDWNCAVPAMLEQNFKRRFLQMY